MAEVVNIEYFKRLEENAAPLAQAEYRLFGKPGEHFLAQVISLPRDFEQILSVNLVGGPLGALTAAALGRAVRASFSGRADTPPSRVTAGEEVEGRAQPTGAPTAQSLRLRAGTEFHLAEGELGDPSLEEGQSGAFAFKQTPEETKVGF